MSVLVLQNVVPVMKLSVILAATTDAGKPLDGAGNIVAADGHIAGIAMDNGIAGDDVAILAQGQCDVIAGGAITAMDYVKVGTGGKFLSADAAALAAGKVIGKALTGASGDGVTFTLLVGTL